MFSVIFLIFDLSEKWHVQIGLHTLLKDLSCLEFYGLCLSLLYLLQFCGFFFLNTIFCSSDLIMYYSPVPYISLWTGSIVSSIFRIIGELQVSVQFYLISHGSLQGSFLSLPSPLLFVEFFPQHSMTQSIIGKRNLVVCYKIYF